MLPIIFLLFLIPTGSSPQESIPGKNFHYVFVTQEEGKRMPDTRQELFKTYPSLVLEVEVPLYRP